MSNEIETILSIIPQSYYDFIAKIIPGLTSIEIILFLSEKNLIYPRNIWEIIFSIIAVYIIGLSLDLGGLALSYILDYGINILHNIIVFVISYDPYENYECQNKGKILKTIKDIHDELHKIDKNENHNQDSNIIVKMLAETVLLRSLSLFFIILFALEKFQVIPINEVIENQQYWSIGIAAILCLLRLILQYETSSRTDSMLQSQKIVQ